MSRQQEFDEKFDDVLKRMFVRYHAELRKNGMVLADVKVIKDLKRRANRLFEQVPGSEAEQEAALINDVFDSIINYGKEKE
jgi:hypothetical protein